MSEWGRKLAKNLARGERKWKPDYVCNKWNIVRGDVVEVIHGPHSGQQGKIQAVIRRKNRVIVEGVNMVGECFIAAGGCGCLDVWRRSEREDRRTERKLQFRSDLSPPARLSLPYHSSFRSNSCLHVDARAAAEKLPS